MTPLWKEGAGIAQLRQCTLGSDHTIGKSIGTGGRIGRTKINPPTDTEGVIGIGQAE